MGNLGTAEREPRSSFSSGSSDTATAKELAHITDLVYLFGQMTLNLIGAVGLVVVSLVILDLGPALLASTLPFNINPKLLTRGTGVLTLGLTYIFVMRFCYLALRIRSRSPYRLRRGIGQLNQTGLQK